MGGKGENDKNDKNDNCFEKEVGNPAEYLAVYFPDSGPALSACILLFSDVRNYYGVSGF